MAFILRVLLTASQWSCEQYHSSPSSSLSPPLPPLPPPLPPPLSPLLSPPFLLPSSSPSFLLPSSSLPSPLPPPLPPSLVLTGAVENVYEAHHFAQSETEAAEFCLKAGCDWCCGRLLSPFVHASHDHHMTFTLASHDLHPCIT